MSEGSPAMGAIAPTAARPGWRQRAARALACSADFPELAGPIRAICAAPSGRTL